MTEPSNIRVNPFTGTGGATNYIELTEKHIIPANSPYVIRLNEVPEKQDPSNMKMVYVDSATGAATENALTEVAATPGQGEFRPDYSTNALDDKTWNTGLIEFSASDAGKIVQVTYTGTGTLAGVNSNHWPSWYTDRGDGSDGDFIPTSNTTISGVKNYKSVFIKSGLTITVDKYVLIKCQGAFINNGTITANGKGAPGGAGGKGSSDGGTQATVGASGFNTGGAGGKGYSIAGAAGGGISVYDTSLSTETINELVLNYPFFFKGAGGGGGGCNSSKGNNGGNGGDGGGCILIVCDSFSNTKITANGNSGGDGSGSTGGSGGGGGGGGACIIICKTLNTKATITASGGAGGAYTGNSSYYSAGAAGSSGYVYTKTLGI